MIQREKRALPRRACTKTIGIRSYGVGRVDCTKIAPDDFEPRTTPTIAQLLEAARVKHVETVLDSIQ